MTNTFVQSPVPLKTNANEVSDNLCGPANAQPWIGHKQLAPIGTTAIWQSPQLLAFARPDTKRGNQNNGAVRLYRRSLAVLREGNSDLALELIRAACSSPDAFSECYHFHADLLRRNSNLDTATRVARDWVAKYPTDPLAWDFLGEILAQQNEFNQSKMCYEKAIEFDPTRLNSIQNLATTLLRLGYTKEAEVKYREILRCAPDNLDATLNLACLLNGSGRYLEALAIVERALARNPEQVKPYVIASALEYNLERYQKALIFIDNALVLAPDQVDLLTRRAAIALKLGNNYLALTVCDKVLARFPHDAEALRVKARALRNLHRSEEALDTLRFAESVSSDVVDLAVDRAWLLGELGRKGEALQLLDRLISEQPDCAPALDCRSFLSRPKPSHPDISAMKEVIEKAGIPLLDRIRLSLSIGRTYLDAGDGENAFYHLNLGNKLKRSTISYDRAVEERWFSALKAMFSAQHMQYLPSNGWCSARPIFVFGMPRSGTTLVEQIIASHSQVRGNGESPYLNTLARSSLFSAGFSADSLASCANEYLKLSRESIPDEMRFVDKTNSNFLWVGLISLMFPGARMIHCRRDPLDTCLSCYSLLFARGHEFSYDLSELGHYYSLYRDLMAHWRQLLPASKFFEIDYEMLVTDAEAQVRNIIDFCELPWTDACLRFHETDRLVRTSSFDQVRSPIYQSSLGRAEPFRAWLGALTQAYFETAFTEALNSSKI